MEGGGGGASARFSAAGLEAKATIYQSSAHAAMKWIKTKKRRKIRNIINQIGKYS